MVTALVSGLLAASPAEAAGAKGSTFGTLADGRAVPAVTLTNASGIAATVIAYGALLQSLVMPGRDGTRADVVLGYASMADYLATPQYFGATVKHYANRVAAGRFTLDGKSYQLPVNDGPNSLHGGTVEFERCCGRWSR